MLEAVAIFLFILSVLCGLVTYISAHNNPLKIPDLSKPGSIATVSLLLGAITAGMWPPMAVYSDCSNLAQEALDIRKSLIDFELKSVGGEVDVLVSKPSESMIAFFEEHEACFEVPQEHAFRRITYAKPSDQADIDAAEDDAKSKMWTQAQRDIAMVRVRKHIDQIGLLSTAVNRSHSIDRLLGEFLRRHDDVWKKEPAIRRASVESCYKVALAVKNNTRGSLFVSFKIDEATGDVTGVAGSVPRRSGISDDMLECVKEEARAWSYTGVSGKDKITLKYELRPTISSDNPDYFIEESGTNIPVAGQPDIEPLVEKITAIRDGRGSDSQKEKSIEAAKTAYYASWEARKKVLSSELDPMLRQVRSYLIDIDSRQAMLLPSSGNCPSEDLNKETNRSIKRKNENFESDELKLGMDMTVETFSPVLPAGPSEPGADATEDQRAAYAQAAEAHSKQPWRVLYMTEVKSVQKLGRNPKNGEIDFELFPQVQEAVFNSLLGQAIAENYSGDLATAQAVTYATAATAAELSCFTTAKYARESCNETTLACTEAQSKAGISEERMSEKIGECLELRTACYIDQQEQEEGEASAPESCEKAATVCDEVEACVESERRCELESVRETLDITAARCQTRVHAEVKRQCFSDQTTTIAEQPEESSDEQG